MTEWWTYTLSDFLLFSPRTYYRLFALHNAALWPGHVAAGLAGVALLVLATIRPRRAGLAAGMILAAAWGAVGWGYFFERYAAINWVAPWYAAGFALQAGLLTLAAAGGQLAFSRPAPARAACGLALLGFGLVLQPLLTPLCGRPWAQVELFAIAPDPTAVATVGMILAADRVRWWLLVLPLLWCAITTLTLWTMAAPDAWAAAVAVGLAMGAAGMRGRRRPS